MDKYSYVYILSNKRNTVLYVGVTNDLIKRIWEHKQKLVKGFTKRYGVDKLVYYETLQNIIIAIEREKQIKGGSRVNKMKLINSVNPKWKDFYEDLVRTPRDCFRLAARGLAMT